VENKPLKKCNNKKKVQIPLVYRKVLKMHDERIIPPAQEKAQGTKSRSQGTFFILLE
jgi:hypothetical protein